MVRKSYSDEFLPRKRSKNPKRSERELFGDAFDRNPFEDFEPLDMYEQLQWDKEPEAVWEIDAPEPLVALGELAALDYGRSHEKWAERDAPFLAVGRDTNVLYVVPKDAGGGPIHRVPTFNPRSTKWRVVGQVRQTDYYSSKGNEPAYYFHEHEAPHPTVWEHTSGVRVLVPANHRGKRSYAVAKEGIVG